ncbi:transcription termination/antitermination protein NusG [Longimicrobium sp.]|uniref:transcription termination/antitermination protein NusG n=1 Tax=Longimicrobium sp. TaxID=2029185 RepID=UPI002E3786D8|nr:transcription termination/antitermination protein NusG [Longimicrobium sp.]HEX6039972.1 transcription termination/antitermination protein NusG [Longimicrobium sp.]
MADAKWYAIQSYSGHENKVQRLIQRRIDEEQGEPESKQIQEVMVPTREEVELRNGKRVTVTRKLYPGYVLVKMVYNQRTAHLVNSIQGVIKFLGTGAEPQPLTDDELAKVMGQEVEAPAAPEAPVVLIPFTHGQVVEVTDGPFKEFSGTVQEIDHDKGKVKVEVSLFGRPTSIELDYTQLRGF